MKFKKGDWIKDDTFISIVLDINQDEIKFKDIYTFEGNILRIPGIFTYPINILYKFTKLTDAEKLELL